ncbi:MAG TPA: AzlD domain-containing protein, partial [Capillimicrobium sp.]
MSDAWLLVALVGAGTIAMKAAGPALLGGREVPPRARGLLALLGPAVLGALIVTQAFAGDRELVLDPRAAGLAAAAVALLLR